LYVVVVSFVLAFILNAHEEAFGPANVGWVPDWSTFEVLQLTEHGPLAEAGARPHDVVETVNGMPLHGMLDWFIARAHRERYPPIVRVIASP
jgi:hypothetical protein